MINFLFNYNSLEKKHKLEIEELIKDYGERINKMKIKHDEEIDNWKNENADLKLRLDNMLEEYQKNLKDKDKGSKKVIYFIRIIIRYYYKGTTRSYG
jgi:hypothetical protein